MDCLKRFAAAIRVSSQLRNGTVLFVALVILLIPITFTHAQQGQPMIPNLAGFPDPGGVVRTFSQNGNIDQTGPFFKASARMAAVAPPVISRAMR